MGWWGLSKKLLKQFFRARRSDTPLKQGVNEKGTGLFAGLELATLCFSAGRRKTDPRDAGATVWFLAERVMWDACVF